MSVCVRLLQDECLRQLAAEALGARLEVQSRLARLYPEVSDWAAGCWRGLWGDTVGTRQQRGSQWGAEWGIYLFEVGHAGLLSSTVAVAGKSIHVPPALMHRTAWLAATSECGLLQSVPIISYRETYIIAAQNSKWFAQYERLSVQATSPPRARHGCSMSHCASCPQGRHGVSLGSHDAILWLLWPHLVPRMHQLGDCGLLSHAVHKPTVNDAKGYNQLVSTSHFGCTRAAHSIDAGSDPVQQCGSDGTIPSRETCQAWGRGAGSGGGGQMEGTAAQHAPHTIACSSSSCAPPLGAFLVAAVGLLHRMWRQQHASAGAVVAPAAAPHQWGMPYACMFVMRAGLLTVEGWGAGADRAPAIGPDPGGGAQRG
jgi:hypothetical protein